MPPRVLNASDVGKYPPNSVYIGRPSKWGNPFYLGKDQAREEVIDTYYEYVIDNALLMESLYELVDKDLICWCAPLPCHGDVLLMLANTD
jgi:uncharacterized protein DUF4326